MPEFWANLENYLGQEVGSPEKMLEIRADQKDYSAYTLLISNEEKGRIPREEIGLYLLCKEKTLADTNNFFYSFFVLFL